jgi:hypothetical protein
MRLNALAGLLAYQITQLCCKACLLTYVLYTYSMKQSLWEANRFSLVKPIPSLYGIRRFITAFTRAVAMLDAKRTCTNYLLLFFTTHVLIYAYVSYFHMYYSSRKNELHFRHTRQ